MLTVALLTGCTDDGGTDTPDNDTPKSAACELLTFSLDGERNGLESTIEFTIDNEARTVKGVYETDNMPERPATMVPSFTIDGDKVRIGGVIVESDVARLSFSEELLLVVVAENGDNKTYRVNLEWNYEEPGPPPSDERDLTAFSLTVPNNDGLEENIVFTLDETRLTFSAMYLHWIEGDAPEMLVPTFTTTGETVTVAGAEVASGGTAIPFTDDFEVTVTAENGETKVYTVSLNCPQINSELAVLHFTNIVPSQITSKDDYIKSRLEMYSPHTEEGWWSEADEEVEIRGRGNSTWGLPKKPYRVKFPNDHSPLGLSHAEAKSWTLLAHDMDKSLLRGHIAYGISGIMFDATEGYHDPKAVMFSPASQHVNVYFNGEYHGLYQMSDQVERKKGRVNVDKLTAADGTVFTGGYLLESSIHPDNNPGFNTNVKGYKFLMKYPEDDDYAQTQLEWIDNFIGQAETALYSQTFRDETSGWRKWFDEKTMADFIIVKEIVGDMDGYTSTYCYKRNGVEKLFFGPVWDCDKGWNNEVRVPSPTYQPTSSLMIKAGFQMDARWNAHDDWFNRVWEDADFRAFVAQRWAQKRDEIVAFIMHELDRKPTEMAKSIEANFTVWPFYYQASVEARMPAETYELEIERLRSLTIERAELLDRLFNE